MTAPLATDRNESRTEEPMVADYTAVTPEAVTALTDDAIARADSLIDGVARAGAPDGSGTATFETVLRPLDTAWAVISEAEGRGAFLSHVHPDPAVRDAAQRADERTRTWRVQVAFRDDLYAAVRRYAETAEAASLEGEARRFLDFWLRDFRRAGHELDPDERAELQRLRTRLVELEVDFQRAIDEYQDWIDLEPDGLAGLPEHYVARLRPGDAPGTLRVTLDYPDLFPFLDQAERRDLREVLEAKHFNRAVEHNRPILEEALQVRDAIAERLGYPTWAHYALEVKMAREPAAVERFYEELLPPLATLGRREIDRMADLLEADTGDRQVQSWDWRYYDTLIRRREMGVDPTEVAAHLPLQAVIDGLLDLTGEVFGLRYRRIEATKAWHPDVLMYEIIDAGTDETIATFYADLFPRDGKYGHAMAVQLVVGHERADGTYEKPVSAIVANLAKPTADQPSLLQHSEVLTLFHEFGHILHMSLTQARFVRFSGAETEWDFVEAPSQIMEHWTWRPAVLKRFARHHRTGEPIPTELVERLAAARDLDEGIRATRQLSFGMLDLAMHSVTGPRDLDAIYRQAFAITGFPFHEGTFLPAGWGHVMGGYDAGYYGYMWSEVYGDDMFGRFEAEGVTSPEVGMAYRREILEPNGSRDAIELLRAFLGREPSNEEFLRLRGITLAPSGAEG